MLATTASRFTGLAERRPRGITWVMVVSTVLLGVLAGLPSLWPTSFPMLHGVMVDTDPENMLAGDEPVRIFHNAMKRAFSLHDMVVVGIVNDEHPDGVFNPESLQRVFALTQFARTLQWPDPDHPDRRIGVVEADMLAPSMVDTIEQAGLGAVSFSWLMPEPPETRDEALAVRDAARALPMLDGTLVSEDGRALALYLPLTHKDLSYRVRSALLEHTADWAGTGDEVHITGLPVAEDTFGVQMFYQMAISAPLAMLVIFLVMWWFFRHLTLVTSPMVVAMVSAMGTMGLLVVTGNTIHIMSSMIPVFIMPIAVLDAVHILSEFFDRYPHTRDRVRTIRDVVATLFAPMLFTTLTTMAGFASLALTPIPPVQVFGVFVAVGVFLAWLWTMLFIPAFILMMPEEKLAGFGHASSNAGEAETPLSRGLRALGRGVAARAKPVLGVTAVVVAVAIYGIGTININDNPVKWFEPAHPIRVADRVLNTHFGGTYMAYLTLRPAADADAGLEAYREGFRERLRQRQAGLVADGLPEAGPVFDALAALADAAAAAADDKAGFLASLGAVTADRLDGAPDDRYFAWDEAQVFLDAERQRDEIFKAPEVLRYIDALETVLSETGVVGKSNSLADLVKTVHRELLLGAPEEFRIPDSPEAVAQTLLTFQNSHRPYDLWHLVTPDYRSAALWVQLTSGDNEDMARVVDAVNAFTAANPPPRGLETAWFGLTYINVIWQEKMVAGMLAALLGSFGVVLVLMAVLFRSPLWGALCMIPLTVTIGLIYGIIGLIGKDYDMPIAVLSALSLGLAVDYAIHFLSRTRATVAAVGAWSTAVGPVFDEPARAITRNAVVLGVGFLPLLAAPLVPYQTVGVFIAAILFTAGVGTLLILPALVTVLQRWLFRTPSGADQPAGTVPSAMTPDHGKGV